MTSTFSVSRDDVINRALRLTGAYDNSNPPGTVDYTNVSLAFNILIKQWIKSGIPMWKIVTIPVPMVVGQIQYQIGPFATGPGAVVCDKLLRVLNAYITDAFGFDVPIDPLSWQEYNQYGDKTSLGIPNSYLFQPNIDSAAGLVSFMNVYPTCPDTTHTINLTGYQVLQDVNVGTDPVDYPQETYNALCWGLANEISMEYATSMDRVQEIKARSTDHYNMMVDWSQENTDSIRLLYDRRGQY
jgi:hypothetical protein